MLKARPSDLYASRVSTMWAEFTKNAASPEAAEAKLNAVWGRAIDQVKKHEDGHLLDLLFDRASTNGTAENNYTPSYQRSEAGRIAREVAETSEAHQSSLSDVKRVLYERSRGRSSPEALQEATANAKAAARQAAEARKRAVAYARANIPVEDVVTRNGVLAPYTVRQRMVPHPSRQIRHAARLQLLHELGTDITDPAELRRVFGASGKLEPGSLVHAVDTLSTELEDRMRRATKTSPFDPDAFHREVLPQFRAAHPEIDRAAAAGHQSFTAFMTRMDIPGSDPSPRLYRDAAAEVAENAGQIKRLSKVLSPLKKPALIGAGLLAAAGLGAGAYIKSKGGVAKALYGIDPTAAYDPKLYLEKKSDAPASDKQKQGFWSNPYKRRAAIGGIAGATLLGGGGALAAHHALKGAADGAAKAKLHPGLAGLGGALIGGAAGAVGGVGGKLLGDYRAEKKRQEAMRGIYLNHPRREYAKQAGIVDSAVDYLIAHPTTQKRIIGGLTGTAAGLGAAIAIKKKTQPGMTGVSNAEIVARHRLEEQDALDANRAKSKVPDVKGTFKRLYNEALLNSATIARENPRIAASTAAVTAAVPAALVGSRFLAFV